MLFFIVTLVFMLTHLLNRMGQLKGKMGTYKNKVELYFFNIMFLKAFGGRPFLLPLINRLPSKILGSKSPWKSYPCSTRTLTLQINSNLEYLGRILCTNVHSNQMGKLDPKAVKCVF